MSAEVAGFKAVALGGRGEGDLLLAAIDQLKHKPQIIILFDFFIVLHLDCTFKPTKQGANPLPNFATLSYKSNALASSSALL